MNNEKRKYLALVTGGTRGIGEAICKEFLKKDIEVIITGTSKIQIIQKDQPIRKLIS